MRFLICLILLFIALPAKAETKVTRDIAYGREKLQKLDVYAPSTCPQQGCPVVIWVHGGGWRNGDKSHSGATGLGALWADHGAVVVTLNYRLTPDVMHPAHVQDVAAGISWVYRTISRYNGNPDKIYLLGHSAGAHLVALVATDPQYLGRYGLTPSQLAGVFPVDSASYNLERNSNTNFVGKLIINAFGDDPQVLRDASPLFQVKAGRSYPPFILSAVKQRPDSVAGMQALQRKLQGVGAQAEAMVMDYPDENQLGAHGAIAKDLLDPSSALTLRLMRAMGLRLGGPALNTKPNSDETVNDTAQRMGRRLLLRQLMQ